MKLLFHVQHLLGIGHARRASLLAQALSAHGFAVTVASGGFPVPVVSYAPARLVQLPPARATDTGISALVDEAGRPLDSAWKDRRAAALLALAAEIRPDIVLVEGYPFARRAFRFELEPLIAASRGTSPRALIVSSVRDILVAGSPAKQDAAAETARTSFDLVLVHGDPALVRFGDSFGPAGRIADLIRYTGYVEPERASADPDGPGAGEVIVSAGGGAVGEPLLRGALAARPLSVLADRPWRLLTGPDAPPGLADALRGLAPPGVIVETMRDDLPRMLARGAMSISQAGYNTVMDVLAAGCRSVLVPFAGPGQTEQRQRAALLAARGLAVTVDPDELTPATLAAAVGRAAALPKAAMSIRLGGGAEAARLVEEALHRLRMAA